MHRDSVAACRRSLRAWLLPACLVVLQTQLLGAQQTTQAQYGARRAALARAIGNGVLVVHAAPEAAINRIGYVPDENLRYLTGLREPGAALVLTVRAGVASERLFVNEREPAAEVWTGVRRGPARTQALTGLATAPIAQLGTAIDSLLGAADTLLVANDTSNTSPVGRLLQELRKKGKAHAVRSGVRPILALRATKSQSEIELIATAAAITTSGFTSAVM